MRTLRLRRGSPWGWVFPALVFGTIAPMVIAREQRDSEETPAARALAELLEAEWQWQLEQDPKFASSLGDTRYNDRWPDLSLDAIERRHEHRQETLKKLDAIPAEQLEGNDRLNHQLFRRELQSYIEEHPFQWYLVPLNHREGIQDENSVADALPFRTVKDYEDWIARLRAFPEYMRQTIELMRAGTAAGIVQPKVVTQRIPEQVRKQIVDEATKSLFYKPFRRFPDSIERSDRARLELEGQRAIRESIVPAYREFAKFLDQEYLPESFEQVGAWQFPRGQEFYAVRARRFTTTDLTPEQIHQIGLKEVARIRGEMHTIMKQVKFDGTFQQFLEHLRTDKRFYYQSAEEMFDGYLALCKRIDPTLTKLFRKLPRTPYGLEPVPDNIAPDTTAAYYRPPSADGLRPGTYFINLYRPEMRPKYEMEALSLHEAVPGHHLQIALAMEEPDLPQFRRHSEVTAYIEGWALYAESLGTELGLYTDPYSKFGQLTYEMWRAVRLVVDTGMHSKKWTRDQAIAFFRENTAKTELDIVNEVDRYIAWPGQALAYKIGELKIKELRRTAEKTLGEHFDVREFHDVILSPGAVPLDVLEGIVTDWIVMRRLSMGPKE